MRDLHKKNAEVVAAWKLASSRLGIRVVAPFDFNVGQTSYKCAAYLPDFGGFKGMLVQTVFPPNFISDQRLARDAREEGYFVSFVNAETYCRFDLQTFQEALNDWGFVGRFGARPSWMEKDSRD